MVIGYTFVRGVYGIHVLVIFCTFVYVNLLFLERNISILIWFLSRNLGKRVSFLNGLSKVDGKVQIILTNMVPKIFISNTSRLRDILEYACEVR